MNMKCYLMNLKCYAIRILITFLITSLPLKNSFADSSTIVLVVHHTSPITEISRQQATHLFFGRINSLPNTGIIEVIDYQPLREEFYQALVNQNIAEINAYWARLRFSGKTRPPRQVFTFKELTNQLTLYNNTISYTTQHLVTNELRVVTFIEQSE